MSNKQIIIGMKRAMATAEISEGDIDFLMSILRKDIAALEREDRMEAEGITEQDIAESMPHGPL